MAWGTAFRASSRITVIDPLITERATIRTNTPRQIPSIEITDVKDSKKLCFFVSEYLKPKNKESELCMG
jgi:hypothetical protein